MLDRMGADGGLRSGGVKVCRMVGVLYILISLNVWGCVTSRDSHCKS